MQWRISRMLYSNLLLLNRSSQFPKACSIMEKENKSTSHFSTIPKRPMRGGGERGGGGGERRDDNDPSERFLRNLNFGGGSGGDDDQRSPHSGIRDRPTRTEKRPFIGIGRRSHNGGDFDGGDSDGEALLGKFDFGGEDACRGTETPLREPEVEEVDEMFKNMRAEQRPTRVKARERGPFHDDQDSLKQAGGDTLLGKLDFACGSGGNKAKEAQRSSTSRPVQEQAVEDADEIFKKMKETGLIPNAVAMLDGLCKDGLVQEAMKLFGTMREKGTIPEVVIYTAVVEGFCRAAKFDDAKRIFRKMQKNEIVPNAFSYGVLIQGLSKGKRLEDAVEFCMEMLDVGHVPNAATLTGLVDGFCKEKGAEEGEGFVRSLRERGFAIDEKAVREHLDKKGPYSPMVWEAIFGKNARRPF
ncbi:pentatricopeptide repeat-containing protein [Iris pallida]|uniref:Pentatricopeptide repeat-containing protein n=1 Tax=Iris pallida TaxID=29817 RepID=A0AAX6F709_IRIPA|nr:pentatricopeptide repeat-containing protein [Iris pallida]